MFFFYISLFVFDDFHVIFIFWNKIVSNWLIIIVVLIIVTAENLYNKILSEIIVDEKCLYVNQMINSTLLRRAIIFFSSQNYFHYKF